MADPAPILRDDRHRQAVPRRAGARRRRLPALARRGARADGRERRRQVDPDQGAHRRLRHRRRRRSRWTARPVAFASPLQAQQAGISTVYQEVNLCPNLSVAENIFIGREPRRFGRIHWREMRRRAAELLAGSTSTSTSPRRWRRTPWPCSRWSRSPAPSTSTAQVLILDEPTSSLDADEVAQLFRVMRQLQGRGHRDPVRLALPRPGLRDRRPDDRAAQRPARRRVPHQRAAARSSWSRR